MNPFKEKLDSIVNKTFSYRNENVTITKYKPVNGTNTVIFLNHRPKNLLNNELEMFFNELLDPAIKNNSFVPNIEVPKENVISFQPTKDNETLKQTLMETLKKVKDDATYIPQANAVCNVVSQMVNIQKEELKMIQMLRK